MLRFYMANQKPFPPIGREGVLKHCKEAMYTRYLSFVVDRFVTYCMNAHDHHHQRGEATSTQCFLYDCMLLFVRKPTILIVAAVDIRIGLLHTDSIQCNLLFGWVGYCIKTSPREEPHREKNERYTPPPISPRRSSLGLLSLCFRI